MTTTFRWRTIATTGGGVLMLLLAAACTDSTTAPTGPPRVGGTRSSVGPRATTEQLYLIDNKCPANSATPGCQLPNGSVIYTVVLSGTTGTNTLFKSLTGHCATDPAIDCDLFYDQAHIGASPDGARIYAVNRRFVGASGNPVGYVDVATGNFIHLGQIAGIGKPTGLVLVAFSPAGNLYVANQDDDRIYRINLSTLSVAQSWSIARPGGVGMLDLDGADIAFDAADVLYLYTNSSKVPGDRGLYTIDLGTTVATSTRVGAASTRLFTGMAIRDAGLGNLVMSNAVDDKYYEIDRTSGAVVATYQMAGDLTDHLYGDMTVGMLAPPPPPPDQLYLIDNKCLSNSSTLECQHANGSVIYTVVLSGTTGTNTLWKSLTGNCATNPAIDCDVFYDQAHIGASPDGRKVYAVNRRTIGSAGNPVGYVDVATLDFIHVGQITGIGRPDGLVLVAFSPSGDLYVGNQDDNRIYKISLGTLSVTQSWSIARPGGVGLLDLDGADMAFDAGGVLYVYTNASKTPADRGLYTLDLTTTVATSVRVTPASVPYFFTGMAILVGGTGDAVLSSAVDDKYYEIDRTTGAVVATYQMAGDLTDHLFGDMTIGPITPPPVY